MKMFQTHCVLHTWPLRLVKHWAPHPLKLEFSKESPTERRGWGPGRQPGSACLSEKYSHLGRWPCKGGRPPGEIGAEIVMDERVLVFVFRHMSLESFSECSWAWIHICSNGSTALWPRTGETESPGLWVWGHPISDRKKMGEGGGEISKMVTVPRTLALTVNIKYVRQDL